MRFVSIKTVEQADMQALHRARSLFVKHRTAVINQIRGLLAEYGLVIAQSPEKVRPAVVRFLDDAESGLTACARDTFSELYEQLKDLDSRIERGTHRVERVYRTHPVCRKLAAVPGIGPLTATALLATVGRPQAFQNGRHLAAWLGLVPRQYSSGGKEILGGISKRGNRYVRTLLIHGARAVVQQAARRTDTQGQWLCTLMRRKGTNVAAVALANKNARVIWALLAHDEAYRPPSRGKTRAERSSGREEQRAASHTRRLTPKSAARTICDDTRGTPSAVRPWTNCRPGQGRCANEENARVFHQGPDTLAVHQEAGYIDAALHLLVHGVTRRRCTEGWVHI